MVQRGHARERATGRSILNFADGSGNPLGDPYGSMAMMSVVVPNAISNGQSLATIQVLIDGLKLEQFDSSGGVAGRIVHE